jgi:hypothetical protein
MPKPGVISLCGKSLQPGDLTFVFSEHDEVVELGVLSKPPRSAKHDGTGFTVDPSRSGFLAYNIVQEKTSDTAPLDDCTEVIDQKTQEQADLKADLEAKERSVTNAELRATRLRERLKSEQQDAASYTGIAGSTTEVTKALARVDTTRGELEKGEKELDLAKDAQRLAKKATDDFPERARKELGADLDRALYIANSLRAGAVIKIGAIFVGAHREAVFYDFTARPSNSTLHLTPLGNYPTVTQDERLFAVIANVDTSRHPFPFRLSASVIPGTPINIEPVRPTFAVGGEAAFNGAPTAPVFAQAYRDVVLAVRDTVPPNGIVEATITTERPTKEDPKKLESVTLVEKAKYPQSRARYRYNFASGVFRSKLRDTQYVKVKTVDDDPATTNVNEARYRIDDYETDRTTRPGFALSYYFFPVDIQSRVGWREWLPAPTIAFAFVKPQDNIYLGLTHELWRNVQLFYGSHFGVTNELVTRNVISEDRDATAPQTRERRGKGQFTWGLTFNISAITKVFK